MLPVVLGYKFGRREQIFLSVNVNGNAGDRFGFLIAVTTHPPSSHPKYRITCSGFVMCGIVTTFD